MPVLRVLPFCSPLEVTTAETTRWGADAEQSPPQAGIQFLSSFPSLKVFCFLFPLLDIYH